jgi:hypothetical protein
LPPLETGYSANIQLDYSHREAKFSAVTAMPADGIDAASLD